MKMKNMFALAILAVLVCGLSLAGEKTKKTTEAKKDGCCMEGKATKASDVKKSDSKTAAHATQATNVKHEKGKGMDCSDDKACSEAHAANTKDGKDCCKEMTKAETAKPSDTPAPKE